jgi:hypothetical protein
MLRLLLLTVVGFTFAQSKSSQLPQPLEGVWSPDSIRAGYNPQIDSNKARTFLSSNLILTDSLFEFTDSKISSPQYEIHEEATNDFFPVFRMNADEIGIFRKAIIEIGVTGRDYIRYVIVDKDRLITFNGGWFVFFSKR